jgi:hypothetical protein
MGLANGASITLLSSVSLHCRAGSLLTMALFYVTSGRGYR